MQICEQQQLNQVVQHSRSLQETKVHLQKDTTKMKRLKPQAIVLFFKQILKQWTGASVCAENSVNKCKYVCAENSVNRCECVCWKQSEHV